MKENVTADVYIYLFFNQDLNSSNYVLANDVMNNELERL
jgi:hypothetical protein